ncbi:MAG TPA: hypothetical protein VLD37_02960 [Candidatus Bilamarchaeum sp.]|nr:hypothetical protein [Candidatus Bilamarchaeum sp.]
MFKLLSRIGRAYFNGDSRRGPRRDIIMRALARSGCKPTLDRFGNIWVEKGSGRPLTLYSAHIDVDPRIRRASIAARRAGRGVEFHGIMDNAIGACLNFELARAGPRKGTAIYVFTASEEVDRLNPRLFARSAKEVVRILRERRLRPDLCVAIDVTYPKLLQKQHEIDWTEGYDRIFDIKDKTHCYLDGFSRRREAAMARKLVRRFGNGKILARRFHGHDEAFVYERIAPSFAFGPVVFGHFDQPGQRMPASHAKTALKFLKSI